MVGSQQQLASVGSSFFADASVRRVRVESVVDANYGTSIGADWGYASAEVLINLKVLDGTQVKGSNRLSLVRAISAVLWIVSDSGAAAYTLSCEFDHSYGTTGSYAALGGAEDVGRRRWGVRRLPRLGTSPGSVRSRPANSSCIRPCSSSARWLASSMPTSSQTGHRTVSSAKAWAPSSKAISSTRTRRFPRPASRCWNWRSTIAWSSAIRWSISPGNVNMTAALCWLLGGWSGHARPRRAASVRLRFPYPLRHIVRMASVDSRHRLTARRTGRSSADSAQPQLRFDTLPMTPSYAA